MTTNVYSCRILSFADIYYIYKVNSAVAIAEEAMKPLVSGTIRFLLLTIEWYKESKDKYTDWFNKIISTTAD